MDETYRLPEAARLLGVEKRTLKRWHKLGRLDMIVTPGGHYRVPASEVVRLQAVRQRSAPASA